MMKLMPHNRYESVLSDASLKEDSCQFRPLKCHYDVWKGGSFLI